MSNEGLVDLKTIAVECCQCERPALYEVQLNPGQKVPMCLEHFSMMSAIQQRQLENAERMINFASDQMDETLGFGRRVGPRFAPRPAPITVGGVSTLNNIHINESIVGTINTGTVGKIDQTVTALIGLSEPQVAEAVKAIAESISNSQILSVDQKNAANELLAAVAREAASPAEHRQGAVAGALLEKLHALISGANDIASICARWWPVIQGVFQN